MGSNYDDVYDRSLRDPEGFWSEAAQEIEWIEPWNEVIDASNARFYRWFVGGVLNTCYNAVDLHVETGRADQAALIYDSPVTDTVRTYTYRELRDEIAAFAGALGRKNSINVMKVLWCCEELGVAFERIDVGGEFGFDHIPGYLSVNPNKRIPTIDDNGLVLWETNVIVRYFALT